MHQIFSLEKVPNYCYQMVSEWIEIKPIKLKTIKNMIGDFQCTINFLKHCFDHLRNNNVDLFQNIFHRAQSYSNDNVLHRDVTRQSYKIIELYASIYIEKDLNKKRAYSREGNDFNGVKNIQPLAFVNFAKPNNYSQGTFLEPFLRNNNDC